MKSINFFVSLLIISILPSLVFASTAYYVDCSAGSNGNGTYERPWNNTASVNNYSFGAGDDVYFKVNTTCTMSAKLNIDWSGTSSDFVTIGAYYGYDQFGLNGNPRPTLDGNNSVPSISVDAGLISKNPGTGYINIKDLKVYQSGSMGILIYDTDYVNIENNYISYSQRHGIWTGRCNNLTITKNTIEQNGQKNNPTKIENMGALVSSGVNAVTTNVVISNNKIFHNYTTEILSVIAREDGTVIEHNVIYDNQHTNVSIYSQAAKNTIIRYNLVYASSDIGNWKRAQGITLENESYLGYCYTGGAKIYGNLLASVTSGIVFGAEMSGCYQTDNLVYNNTIVDSTNQNFTFYPKALPGSGNVINNNISWTISAGSAHANNYSPSGFIWDNNNFDDSVSGNAANNARIYEPPITKKEGWRSIEPEIVNGAELGLEESDPNDVYESGVISTSEKKSIETPKGLKIIIQ